MRDAILQRHGDEFAERNILLHLALGVLSASARLDAVLTKYGSPQGARGADVEREPGADAVLHFVLGLIAFRDHTLRVLEAAAPPTPPPAARESPRAERSEMRELLR